MTEKAFAQADPAWIELIDDARTWFEGPLGGLMLFEEQRLLEDELARYFGGYLVHYGPRAELPPGAKQIQRSVHLGAPLSGSRSSARKMPGRSVSTPPTWWCCSTGWISACRPMACCVKPRAACGPAGTC